MTQQKTIVSLLTFFLVLILLSCGGEAEDNSGGNAAVIPDGIVGAERDIVKELYGIWEKPGHIGSFQEAAALAGVTLTDSLRADLVTRMAANLMMHDMVARYRPYVFMMSKEEKRIAAYIRNYEQTRQEFPPLDSVAAHVGLSSQEVKSRLQFLSSVEMFYDLGQPDEYNALGFSYGSKLADFTFDLGTHVHVMKSGDAPEFNAGCAKEALVIVLREFKEGEVTYNTYDPFSLDPITVNFKDGKVASILPEGTILFTGGTCGTNNMFTSVAHAEQYAAHLPQWQGQALPIQPVAEALVSVEQELDSRN